MSRKPNLGVWAKVSSRYYHDDRILRAGSAAELLFVRSLAFCAESKSDGFISDRQVDTVLGAGMKNVKARADALVNEGLWEATDGGYRVRQWLKWHLSSEQVEAKLAADRARKAEKAAREAGTDSPGIPTGIRSTSALRTEVDTEPEAEPESATSEVIIMNVRTARGTA